MKYGRVTAELKNLPHDEPVFVLRAKDVLAPIAVEMYANLLSAAAAGAEGDHRKRLIRMAEEVESMSAEMIAWQASNSKQVRLPD